ncbi:MAG TPA: hypothetical protein VEY67_12090 [Candidatus Dormibacteraeota bacterium]|nr:hypothetical protein [Candidatus Dormibacteraeota bacterium]
MKPEQEADREPPNHFEEPARATRSGIAWPGDRGEAEQGRGSGCRELEPEEDPGQRFQPGWRAESHKRRVAHEQATGDGLDGHCAAAASAADRELRERVPETGRYERRSRRDTRETRRGRRPDVRPSVPTARDGVRHRTCPR